MDARPPVYVGSDSVIVRLLVGGRLVRVVVSREALETRFDAVHTREGWLGAYQANAQEIEAIVRGKVAKAAHEPVLVSKHDFAAAPLLSA